MKHPRTVEAIIRTIERVCALRRMGVTDQAIAEALAPTAANIMYARDILEDLTDLVEKLRREKPGRNCSHCGREIDSRVYIRSKYCNRRCKQKAYRKRVTVKSAPANLQPSHIANCYGSPVAGDGPAVTEDCASSEARS